MSTSSDAFCNALKFSTIERFFVGRTINSLLRAVHLQGKNSTKQHAVLSAQEKVQTHLLYRFTFDPVPSRQELQYIGHGFFSTGSPLIAEKVASTERMDYLIFIGKKSQETRTGDDPFKLYQECVSARNRDGMKSNLELDRKTHFENEDQFVRDEMELLYKAFALMTIMLWTLPIFGMALLGLGIRWVIRGFTFPRA